MKRQEVDLAIALERAKLDSGDDTDASSLSSGSRGDDSVDGVVIGEGNRRQPATRRGFDHFLRGKDPVRRSGVSVEIDECRPRGARIRTHCS